MLYPANPEDPGSQLKTSLLWFGQFGSKDLALYAINPSDYNWRASAGLSKTGGMHPCALIKILLRKHYCKSKSWALIGSHGFSPKRERQVLRNKRDISQQQGGGVSGRKVVGTCFLTPSPCFSSSDG